MKSSANSSSKVQPASIAIIAFAYFLIVVTALYFLNPSYSLFRSFAGTYDLGSYEFLIASTFFSLGFGTLALVIELYRGITQSARSRRGFILLGIWGVGMLLAGIFPANEPGSTVTHMTTVLIAGIFPVEVQATPETLFSWLHIFAILGSLFSLSLAAFLLSRRFKQDDNWQPIQRLAFLLALLMLASSILVFLRGFFYTLPLYSRLYDLGFSFDQVHIIFIGIVIGLLWLLLVVVRLQFIVVRNTTK
jgi:Protein of unknown function (DUF998)